MVEDKKKWLGIRLFVESDDPLEVNKVALAVLSKIKKYCGLFYKQSIQEYWKIEGNWEVFILFINPVEEKFKDLLDTLGSGWVIIGDGAIWNSSDDNEIFNKKIRWANIEIF